MQKRISLSLILALGIAISCNGGSNDDDADPQPTQPATCTGRTGLPGDFEWTMNSGGLTRSYMLSVPASYAPTTPTPLVMDFHGLGSNAGQEALYTRMSGLGAEKGFLVVTPLGTYDEEAGVHSWNGGYCCQPAIEKQIDDVGYTRDLLDKLESEYCIDPTRVYATGMSNGGFFSNRLACEAADLFAAIAPVASVLGMERCEPSRPISVMMFNGTADPLVPYEGGERTVDGETYGFPGAQESFDRWGEIDRCVGDPTVTYEKGDVVCESYTECAEGVEVTLCTASGHGHTWPGGEHFAVLMGSRGSGTTTTDINATNAMWDFFVNHPMGE